MDIVWNAIESRRENVRIINLSGGIDSSYLLWNELSKNTGHTILVHHCSIVNAEGRALVELVSTRRIVRWLKENVSDSFKYIETTFDYKDIGYVIRDIEIVAFMNAAILRMPKYRVSEILVSANAHDESNDTNEISVVRRRKILDTIGQSGSDSEKLSFPMLELTKKQIIDKMPKDLFGLSWYCRRPIGFSKNGQEVSPLNDDVVVWKTCDHCKTCKQVIDACIELKIDRPNSMTSLGE